MARLRMQRLRQRKNEAASVITAASQTQPCTCAGEAKKRQKRDYWKMRKREQRAKLSVQKKRRIREKENAKKRQKREDMWNEEKTATQPEDVEDVAGTSDAAHCRYSPGARRQAAYRLRSKIPASTSKYVDMVEVLISSASPRKAAALKSRGIRLEQKNDKVLEGVRRTCMSMKGKRRQYFLWQLCSGLAKQHGMKAHLSRTMSLSYKTILKYQNLRRRKSVNPEMRNRRCDATDTTTTQHIANFFERPDISTIMPNKKSVNANNTPKHVLHRSLSETYKRYVQDTPTPVCRAQFSKLRPKHVLPHTKAKLFQCLCEYCTNVDLKLSTITHTARTFRMKCSVLDRYNVLDKTLCDYDGLYPKIACIDRQCKKCGTQQLKKYLEPLITRCTKEVMWQKWEQTTYDKEGKTKRMTLQRHHGELKMLVEELLQEMIWFSRHLFEARWQQAQFYKCIKSPGDKEVIMVMDFAENYLCLMQQEVQAAHRYQAQVTLHPIIAYYTCQAELCRDNEPIRECINVISDDKAHDNHAVAHFVGLAINHLRDKRALEPQKLVQFTDGCSGQHKARVSFTDISFCAQDLKIPSLERHYFGSRHGKNPCDGEGGVVKSCVSRAVKSRPDVVVKDSVSLFEYCKQHLTKEATNAGQCSHSRRTFIHVSEGDINRHRPSRTNVCTLPGTRRINAVRGVAPYEVKSRRLSCFCHSCRQNREELCENKDVTSEWTARKLTVQGASQAKANQPAYTEYPRSSSSYSEGDFVLVRLPMGKRHATFVAEVMKLLDTEVQLQYMEEVKKDVFKWPSTVDISVEPMTHVLQRLPLPTLREDLSSSRVQFFTFKQIMN
uniref:uncharacterized protein isoform X1 n=1 Tax=Myxine glutinosa TaxID=7769 RepID=UPI00358FDA75